MIPESGGPWILCLFIFLLCLGKTPSNGSQSPRALSAEHQLDSFSDFRETCAYALSPPWWVGSFAVGKAGRQPDCLRQSSFPPNLPAPSFRSKQLLRIAPGRWELLLSRVTNLTHDRDDRSTAFLSPTGLQLLLSRAVISVPCCWPASRGPRPVKSSLT